MAPLLRRAARLVRRKALANEDMMLFSEWMDKRKTTDQVRRIAPAHIQEAQLFLFALFAQNLWPTLTLYFPRIAGRPLQSTPVQLELFPFRINTFLSHSLPLLGSVSLRRLSRPSQSRFLPAIPGSIFTEALKLALRNPCPLKKALFLPSSPTCCSDHPVPALLNR